MHNLGLVLLILNKIYLNTKCKKIDVLNKLLHVKYFVTIAWANWHLVSSEDDTCPTQGKYLYIFLGHSSYSAVTI